MWNEYDNLGTFLGDNEEPDTRAEYDFHISLYNNLQRRQVELENEKNSSAKTKLLKQCRQDQVRVKRVLQKLGHDFDAIEEEQEKMETVMCDQPSVKEEEKAKPELEELESAVSLNGNGHAHYEVKKEDLEICPPGPKIEENGNIETNSEHSEKETSHSVSTTNGLQDFQPLDLVWAKCSGEWTTF